MSTRSRTQKRSPWTVWVSPSTRDRKIGHIEKFLANFFCSACRAFVRPKAILQRFRTSDNNTELPIARPCVNLLPTYTVYVQPKRQVLPSPGYYLQSMSPVLTVSLSTHARPRRRAVVSVLATCTSSTNQRISTFFESALVCSFVNTWIHSSNVKQPRMLHSPSGYKAKDVQDIIENWWLCRFDQALESV